MVESVIELNERIDMIQNCSTDIEFYVKIVIPPGPRNYEI